MLMQWSWRIAILISLVTNVAAAVRAEGLGRGGEA